MSANIKIDKCKNCPYLDHSGMFTKGGAKPVCDGPGCVDSFTRSKTFRNKDDKFHWRHRVVDPEKTPPKNKCPLLNAVAPEPKRVVQNGALILKEELDPEEEILYKLAKNHQKLKDEIEAKKDKMKTIEKQLERLLPYKKTIKINEMSLRRTSLKTQYFRAGELAKSHPELKKKYTVVNYHDKIDIKERKAP